LGPPSYRYKVYFISDFLARLYLIEHSLYYIRRCLSHLNIGRSDHCLVHGCYMSFAYNENVYEMHNEEFSGLVIRKLTLPPLFVKYTNLGV